jgi:hypothetical protein
LSPLLFAFILFFLPSLLQTTKKKATNYQLSEQRASFVVGVFFLSSPFCSCLRTASEQSVFFSSSSSSSSTTTLSCLPVVVSDPPAAATTA